MLLDPARVLLPTSHSQVRVLHGSCLCPPRASFVIILPWPHLQATGQYPLLCGWALLRTLTKMVKKTLLRATSIVAETPQSRLQKSGQRNWPRLTQTASTSRDLLSVAEWGGSAGGKLLRGRHQGKRYLRKQGNMVLAEGKPGWSDIKGGRWVIVWPRYWGDSSPKMEGILARVEVGGELVKRGLLRVFYQHPSQPAFCLWHLKGPKGLRLCLEQSFLFFF